MAPPRRGFYGKVKRNKKSHAKKSQRTKYTTESTCKSYKKVNCGSVDANCGWRKKIGCVHKKGSRKHSGIYYGPTKPM